jgi:hypothetical protein
LRIVWGWAMAAIPRPCNCSSIPADQTAFYI